jgi:hypothetical protein
MNLMSFSLHRRITFKLICGPKLSLIGAFDPSCHFRYGKANARNLSRFCTVIASSSWPSSDPFFIQMYRLVNKIMW